MTKGQRSNRETADYILKSRGFQLLDLQKLISLNGSFAVSAKPAFAYRLEKTGKKRHNP